MNKLKRAGFAALVLVLIVSFVLVSGSVFAEATEVQVNDNGKTASYTTEAETVAELFLEQGIEVAEDDLIVPAKEASLEGVDEVSIYRAASITITADGVDYKLRTAATSVKEAVEQVTDLFENDTVIPSGKTMVKDGMHITVHRAKNIQFSLYGRSAGIVTSEETVEGFLEARGILLGEADQITPALDARITEGMVLSIDRVEVKTETREVEVPFQKETKNNASLESGKTKVVQEGVNGTKEETLEVTYKNGEIASSAVVAEKVLKAPVSEVTEVGTKKPVVQAAGGASFSYSKVLTCSATAYDASAGCNGKWAGKTASGIPLERGVVAVDPKVIPLGTRLYIEAVDGSWTYGYAVAGDTGGAIKGNKVDLFMETYNECIQFGRRQCKVYVLN